MSVGEGDDLSLIVQGSGTGLAEADAYVTVSEYKTRYAVTYDLALTIPDGTTATDTQLGVAIRRGTILIEGYGSRFRGHRTDPDQALCWPRTGAYRTSGGMRRVPSSPMSSDMVPKAVKVASCFASSYALQNPDEINQLIEQHRLVKREKIGGRVTVERQYSDLASSDSVRRMLTVVEEILDDMLAPRDDKLDARPRPTAGLWVSQYQSVSINNSNTKQSG